jgi:dimethylargininase
VNWNEGGRLSQAVVCPPEHEYALVDDTARQNFQEVPDASLALSQHAALVARLEGVGVEVARVPELVAHPNSVFVRDVALGVPGGFVELAMGLPARRGEEGWMSAQLRALGLDCVGAIGGEGTLEGGDIFLMGRLALVGLSGRATAAGAARLAALLEPLGYQLRTAPVPAPYLHLGSVLSPIGPAAVVVVAGVLPPDFLAGLDRVEVPPRGGRATANALCLGPGEVLTDPSESPGTVEALEAAGVRVHALDLSEFRKGSGGPTCLVLPISRG